MVVLPWAQWLLSGAMTHKSDQIEIDWLKRWAQYSPKAVAMKDADSQRSVSYLEFFERSKNIAQVLRDRFSITHGDRVAVLAVNEIETVFLFFALQRLGAILVPVNYRLTPREVGHILADSQAKVLFYQEAFAECVCKVNIDKLKTFSFEKDLTAQLWREPNAAAPEAFDANFETPVMILYTSGTTGAPKGVVLTHKMLFWNSVTTALRLNLTQNDRTLIFHPFFHTSGLNVLTTPLIHHGGSIVFLKKFDAAKVLELAEQEKISILFGVPTMMDMMFHSEQFPKVSLESVRYAIVGGEPMPVPLIQKWEEKGVPVRQGFGLTEFGPNVFSLNEEDSIRKIGSIGFPNFYIDTQVITKDGLMAKAGEVGELHLRGPMCMAGYWNNEEATKATVQDSWLATGDLVRFDEESYFYVVGRKKDMFISGAENVYPAEVESFLRTHPAIREVAVLGVKDEKWGEVGKAFVSLQPGKNISEDELKKFCCGNLAKYKIPKYFTFLTELPKGDSGKILKRALITA